MQILNAYRRVYPRDVEEKRKLWNMHKEVWKEILLILQRTSEFSSHEIIELNTLGCRITPRDYISAAQFCMDTFDIEDPTMGVEIAVHQLERLSKQFEWLLPSARFTRQRVINLLSLVFGYYNFFRFNGYELVNVDANGIKPLSHLVHYCVNPDWFMDGDRFKSFYGNPVEKAIACLHKMFDFTFGRGSKYWKSAKAKEGDKRMIWLYKVFVKFHTKGLI